MEYFAQFPCRWNYRKDEQPHWWGLELEGPSPENILKWENLFHPHSGQDYTETQHPSYS